MTRSSSLTFRLIVLILLLARFHTLAKITITIQFQGTFHPFGMVKPSYVIFVLASLNARGPAKYVSCSPMQQPLYILAYVCDEY